MLTAIRALKFEFHSQRLVAFQTMLTGQVLCLQTCVLTHEFGCGKPLFCGLNGSGNTTARQHGWCSNQAFALSAGVIAARLGGEVPAARVGRWPRHYRPNRRADSVGDGFGVGFSRPLPWRAARRIISARDFQTAFRKSLARKIVNGIKEGV